MHHPLHSSRNQSLHDKFSCVTKQKILISSWI
jgi:hypothetical protein